MVMYWRPRLSMLPQLGAGGCVPSPRKLSAASTRMTIERLRLAWTARVGAILGRTWAPRMRPWEAPSARAAWTKSCGLRARVALRASTANCGSVSTAIVRTRLTVLGPRAATRAMARRIGGKAKSTSKSRMASRSGAPPQ